MTIDEAAKKLEEQLGEPDIFVVKHSDTVLVVDVNFIYHVEDVVKLGDTYEGFPLMIGRKSCW